jgi:hypothetical protein
VEYNRSVDPEKNCLGARPGDRTHCRTRRPHRSRYARGGQYGQVAGFV